MSTEDNNNKDKLSSDICANCGKGEGAKACTACKLVKYCNRECQIAHWSQHKKACKKRSAELHDEKLFKQPPAKEDCPICFLLLPSISTGSTYQTCCGKRICSGCMHAVLKKREVSLCPFCRTPTPETDEEVIGKLMKRVEVGDAMALCSLGCDYSIGEKGLPQDYVKALELWHQAAKLGCALAYFHIGNAYNNGNGVVRDKKKATYYYELAAMRGDVGARHNLGVFEQQAGNFERALKHYIIAVESGFTKSLETIQRMYLYGTLMEDKGEIATKEDYTKASQAYQNYLHKVKSSQRDEAAAFRYRYKYL